MKSSVRGPLADSIDLYLAHKRSLGKQLVKVGQLLFLLDGYLVAQDVTGTLSDRIIACGRVRSHPATSFVAQL